MKDENEGSGLNQSPAGNEASHAEPFPWSEQYWENRYKGGGNSGAGSYHKFAEFKAEVLNHFVAEEKIKSVIEYGCGDGNQLRLATYPSYLGLDVSAVAVQRCRELFAGDPTKQFKLMSEYANERAELTLSLDVIYHLVEDAVFNEYMGRLFDSSDRWVCIYSSDTDIQSPGQPPHVKHRTFTDWISKERAGWRLAQKILNRYPYSKLGETGSFADFYFYRKNA